MLFKQIDMIKRSKGNTHSPLTHSVAATNSHSTSATGLKEKINKNAPLL